MSQRRECDDIAMTASLVAKDIAGGYAHRVLFDHLDLTVAPGDVVGVVRANGAGKSTLLAVLSGSLAPLEGTVTRAPADAFVGWLPQEHERVPGETVAQYVARRTGCAAASEAMELAAAALADEAPAAWAGTIEQHVVKGSRVLQEVAFLHRPSRTLVPPRTLHVSCPHSA